MSNPTHEALREHMAKWRKRELKQGRVHNPLSDQEEMIRWVCKRIDAVEHEAERKART